VVLFQMQARGFVWLVLAWLVLASASEAQAQGVPLEAIEVAGNERIEAETVEFYLGLEIGEPVTPAQISAALQALQEPGLFEEVSADLREGTLIVTVRERPFINQVIFEGNELIDDEILSSGLRSRPRTVYSAVTVEGDTERIVDAYARAGRLSATVEAQFVERENNRVDVIFEIDEGPVSRVRRVAFLGNRVFSDFTLRRVIGTREAAWYRIFASTDLFDSGRLEADKSALERYYAGRGYADFEVLSAVSSLTQDGSGFVITFTLREGVRYDFGDISIASDLDDIDSESLRSSIDFETGDVYDAVLVEQTLEAMQAEVERSGRPFVEFETDTRRNVEDRTIDVTFRVGPADAVYVERIEILGNERTQDAVIRREFTFVEGDAFNPTDVAATRRNLRALQFFSNVEINVEDGSSPDRVVVQVQVQEQPTGSLTFGVGYSSVSNFVGNISLTERNLLGKGQEVTLQYETADTGDLYQFGFVEPRFRGRDLRAGVTAYRSEDTSSGITQTYELVRNGITPSAEFPLNDETQMLVSYQLETQDTTAGTGTSPLIRSEAGSSLSSSVGYVLTWDRRDDPLQPSSGTILTVGQRLAGLGGDTRAVSLDATGNYFTPLNRDGTLIGSLRFWGGAVTKFGGYNLGAPDLNYIGGSRLRGFSYGGVGPRDPDTNESLGGKYYAVGSAELLSDVFLPEELGIRAGLFVDVGSAWGLDRVSYERMAVSATDADAAASQLGNGRGGTVSCLPSSSTSTSSFNCDITVDDSAAIRSSAGVQLLWNSPIGPMRFVFSTKLLSESHDDVENFRFIIGNVF